MSRLALALFCTAILNAETGREAWLRYAPATQQQLPLNLYSASAEPEMISARAEVVRGVKSMLGRTLRVSNSPEQAIWLRVNTKLPEDGSLIRPDGGGIVVEGGSARGVLYGAFEFLRRISLGLPANAPMRSAPRYSIRWINEWDNLDGTVERGYAGRSIFFEKGHVVSDLTRVSEYGRLLASVGINACAINNVNADPKVLAPEFLPELVRVADALRPWGVHVAISVDLASPQKIGGLKTFDPADAAVANWWRETVDRLYAAIPDLAGFVLKADSEGRAGPSAYGRTHADAANVLARALEPHHGILIYRGFVYNHHLDWTYLKNDRARAAYENFQPLDGKFDSNAAVQIKYGPIDFQVREPVSPLLAGLAHTKKTLELQITQEYTGQQRHLCFLVPMWKETLDTNLGRPVKNLVDGFAGVANVGLDENWMGSDLAMANLYGFGRLAWNPDLTAGQIAHEWIAQTWPRDKTVEAVISKLLLRSWPVYESYTGVLGLQTLTDITHSHYQPNVSSAERNGWGQWIRADEKGVGMDRTVATGTGFVGQYPPGFARIYENVQTTPENLLLFFHHLPYTYRLRDGRTIIQTIYDRHYEGATEANEFPAWWQTLRNHIDDARYEAVLNQLEYQAGHAIVWRDSICKWFLRESDIPDQKGRVGNYPDRVEAESMDLKGYRVLDVDPPENASGGKGVGCDSAECTAAFTFNRPSGWYTLRVEYFDENTGVAKFQVFRNGHLMDSWQADRWLPSATANGDTSVRRSVGVIALENGDRIEIRGEPGGGDRAALDYLEIRSETSSSSGTAKPDRR